MFSCSHLNTLGHLTLLEGPPGIGTSLLATHLAACVPGGLPLPDGSPCQPGNVIFISDLDSDASTLAARVERSEGSPPLV